MDSTEIASVENIRKFWILKLVVEKGSLRKAAQCAKVSPAAVSQTLTALEKIYKRPLLTRKNNKCGPTRDALELLEWISPVFNALNNLDIKLRSKIPPVDYINLGVPEDVAIKYCPIFFKELRSVLPKLKLRIYTGRSNKLVKMVRQGQLCSAIVVQDHCVLETFYTHLLYEDEMGFFVAPHLKEKILSQLVQLESLAMIRSEEEGVPEYMGKFLNQFTPKLKPSFCSDSFTAIYKTALAGEVVALLPKRMAQEGLLEISLHRPLQHKGKHQISLVSEHYCDREEVDFLAGKLKSCVIKNS